MGLTIKRPDIKKMERDGIADAKRRGSDPVAEIARNWRGWLRRDTLF
jgi:hypothetical protein